jgi:hypothetical protein
MKPKVKTARKSFGEDYVCLKNWDEDIFVQCGGHGVVFVRGGENYETAFFEAFPKKPDCFLRGEGSTIEEAESECWDKYQKVISCKHEMERRNRTDGYGYCKHCSYSSTVFEPLTKCCKCNVPTSHSEDYKGKFYCKKHYRNKPKNPNHSLIEKMLENRMPRKEKKLLKNAVTYKYRQEGHSGKVTFSFVTAPKFTCEDYFIHIFTSNQSRTLIKAYNKRNKK